MKLYSKILIFCLIAVLCVSLVSCGADSDYETGDTPGGNTESSIVDNAPNRKIVYEVSMQLETSDVSSLKNSISEKNSALGGYIESNSDDYSDGKCTYAFIIYRIPTEKLDEFVSSVEGHGGVESKNIYTIDITTKYVNAEAKRNALNERKQQLEQLLSDTTVSASDRITIINEISAVNTELESIQIMINEYDSDVNYSTVTITIDEELTFLDAFGPLLIFILILLSYAAIVVLIIALVRKRKTAPEKRM